MGYRQTNVSFESNVFSLNEESPMSRVNFIIYNFFLKKKNKFIFSLALAIRIEKALFSVLKQQTISSIYNFVYLQIHHIEEYL